MIFKYKILFTVLFIGFGFFACRIVMFDSDIFFNLRLFLLYILLVPLLEETVFRWGLQNYIKKITQKRKNRLSGKLQNGIFYYVTIQNIIVSFIFSLTHVPANSITHSFLVFFPSLLFGLVYDMYGKIIFPVVVHGFYNLNIFII